MSDETVNYETNNPAGQARPAGGTEPATERVGFCQDCGTPLTKETLRSVGSGVFCEPCLNVRLGSAAPGAGFVPPVAVDAHPVLAGFLGIIPGVGAMYNGQYAKGVFHVLVFVVLSSLSSHVSDIFKLLGVFWFFYQIIDAYQTAKARQEGRPLPNPFGFNEIGERMGFGRGWTYTGAGWTTAPHAAPAGTTVPPAGAPYTGPLNSGPGWVGYVPPTNFASAPVPPAPAAAQTSTPWGQASYAPTYAPAPIPASAPGYAPSAAYVPPAAVAPAVSTRRFPVGAAWLVGLGLVFLLGEFAPEWGWEWNVTGRWLLPVLFAGLAVWSFTRRLSLGLRTVRGFRAAIILMTLAILFAFQAADAASLARTWPVFLIVLGALLLVERTALNTAGFSSSIDPNPSFVPGTSAYDAEAAAERTRAAWSASGSEAVSHDASAEIARTEHDDSGKDGY